MNLSELSKKLKQVTDNYEEMNDLNVSDDQYVIKINEEVGEFNKAYLKHIKIATNKENKSEEDLRNDVAYELSDIVTQCLVFAEAKKMNLEKLITEKWLKYLPKD